MSMANIGGLAGGAASGLQAGQQFSQNQQMNPYLLQQQQLHNQMMQQKLAGGQAGADWETSLGKAGIQGIGGTDQGQGGAGSDLQQGSSQAGQPQQSGWNQLVDPLGLLQQAGLPLPPDPSTFLASLGLPGLAFGGQPQQGGGGAYLPSAQGMGYGRPTSGYMNPQQPSGMGGPGANYFGVGQF